MARCAYNVNPFLEIFFASGQGLLVEKKKKMMMMMTPPVVEPW